MNTLEISKRLQCSKETLYRVWTEPAALKQWWKPLGHHLVNVENDVKEGGAVKYMFENDALSIDGRYEKVAENQLLEYSWHWRLHAEPIHDANYTLVVRFEGDENESTLQVSQQGFTNEESIQPHQQGWEHGLQQLDDYLKGSAFANGQGDSKKQRPPITSYNETPEQQKVGGG